MKQNMLKSRVSGRVLSENNEENCLSQEVKLKGLEGELTEEVNFNTLPHSNCGLF